MGWDIDVKKTCTELKPLIGVKADLLYQLYASEPNVERRRQLESYLALLRAKLIGGEVDEDQLLLRPPLRHIAHGELVLGQILYNNERLFPFGLNREELRQHAVMFGRTGAGKTNLSYVLLRELSRQNLPFWVFDWKRSYRDLLQLDWAQDIKVFTVGRDVAPFKFNPLIPPPGTAPQEYLPKIVEIIAHAYFLGHGVSYLLGKALDDLYEECGLYKGQATSYPIFQDLLKGFYGVKARGRESLWLASTKRALWTICFGEMGRTVRSRTPFEIEHLRKERVVFELDALANVNKILFIESFLLWLHHFLLAKSQRGALQHVTVIEEAHHILRRKEQAGAETVVETVVREIREFGEGLVMLDQTPSLFSAPGHGNAYSTVGFSLKERDDVRTVGSVMGLASETAQDWLRRLEVGQCIVRLAGRHKEAFLLKVPLVELRSGKVSDEELRERNESSKADETLTEIEQKRESLIPPIPEIPVSPIPPPVAEWREVPLSKDEEVFLRDVRDYPDSGVAERYKRLGWGGNKGNRVQRNLVAKGSVEMEDVESPTGRRRVVRLTEQHSANRGEE